LGSPSNFAKCRRELFVLGAVRQRDIHVQRWGLREAIGIVDPPN